MIVWGDGACIRGGQEDSCHGDGGFEDLRVYSAGSLQINSHTHAQAAKTKIAFPSGERERFSVSFRQNCVLVMPSRNTACMELSSHFFFTANMCMLSVFILML